MAATLYAHLPGVKLAEGDAPFAGGRLARLPFDEWTEMESEYQWASSQYERSQPVFWVRELSTDASDPIHRAVSAVLWPLHMSFLLDHHAPLLPTPMLSSCYVCGDVPPELSDVATLPVMRMIGPMERELIVYGNPLTYTYTTTQLAAVQRRFQFIEANHLQNLDDDVGAGMQVLEETARPDSWYRGDLCVSHLHGFVRCMAACESLLLPDMDEGGKVEKTQTFGRHAAVLFSASAEQSAGAEKEFVELYRLRTRLVHGRTSPESADSDTTAKLAEGRRLLRNVIMAALVLRVSDADRSPLWQRLQRDWKDPERHGHVVQLLTDLPNL